MVKIDRVYTRGGDAGETSLVGGQRVPKHALRIEAYGTIDELNAVLGLCREATSVVSDEPARKELDEVLARLQQELFDLGSELATREEDLVKYGDRIPRATPEQVTRLEQEIDRMNDELPKLTSFILPGGGLLATHLHLARTVCRRAERIVVALHGEETLTGQVVPYINRLSDHLFVLARYAALKSGQSEQLWDPRRSGR